MPIGGKSILFPNMTSLLEAESGPTFTSTVHMAETALDGLEALRSGGQRLSPGQLPGLLWSRLSWETLPNSFLPQTVQIWLA